MAINVRIVLNLIELFRFEWRGESGTNHPQPIFLREFLNVEVTNDSMNILKKEQ